MCSRMYVGLTYSFVKTSHTRNESQKVNFNFKGKKLQSISNLPTTACIINGSILDIQSPISSICDPRVRRSTRISSAPGRSRASIATKNGQHNQVVSSASKDNLSRVSKTNCSTTGFESVSQFKASKRGLILHPRSLTRGFWFA